MSASRPQDVKVFYSYANEDEDLRSELEKYLNSLRRQGLITEWQGRQIRAGTDWARSIDSDLNTASVILLLISPSFMASDYCNSIEMKRIMERYTANEALVIPIILRPVDWAGAPFAKLQALPKNTKPVTAWRTPDEGFLDVVRGIRAIIEAWSTPSISSQSASTAFWNVPFRRNPYFTGREPILSHLYERLKASRVAVLTQPQDISGLGGIGKTQIAIEYAYRHCDEYKAVLWTRADSRESLILDFVAVAEMLQLPEKGAQNQGVALQTIKHWLKTHAQWLLILENADDVTIADDFLPLAGDGHILVTSRAQVQETTAQGIEVEKMSSIDGSLFFLRRAKALPLDGSLDQVSATDYTVARETVQVLDGFPLGLDQAGAYIQETGCGFSGYLDLYRIQCAKLRQRGQLIIDHPESVASTLSLSLEKIEQIKPAAIEILRFCAFLHPDAIPEELIIKGSSYLGPVLQTIADNLIEFDEAMEILRAYSLVRRDANTKTLSLHRLVQSVLRGWMGKNLQRQWAEQAVRAVNHAFPEVEFATWPLCERYLLHAQTCASLIEEWNMNLAEAALLLNQVGHYLYERGQYTKSESFWQRALFIRERVLDPNHHDLATSLSNLATLYHTQGKYAQAEPLYQRALSIDEQALGPNHPHIATALSNLAFLYKDQGKYSQAELLYQRSLAIRERVLGPNHPMLALGLLNLAALYHDQGKYAQAESLYQRSLSINEQALGANHPDLAKSLNGLATLYFNQGKYAQAEPLYQRSLSISEQVLGPDHPIVAKILNNLAALYHVQGKYAQAEPLYQRSLSINEQVLGSNHPEVASDLNNLAALYEIQGEFSQAEPLYQRSLSIRERTLGPNHLEVAQSLNNLAALYNKQNKWSQAEPLYRGALSIREQVLGPNHLDVALVLNNLATVYWKQGKYEMAEPPFRQSLRIYEQILGSNHPNVAAVLENYAILLRKVKREAEASKLEARAKAIQARKD